MLSPGWASFPRSAAAGRGPNFDLRAQGVAELLLQGRDLVARGSRLLAGAGNRGGCLDGVVLADLLADQVFHVADAQAVAFDALGQGDLLVLIAQRQ